MIKFVPKETKELVVMDKLLDSFPSKEMSYDLIAEAKQYLTSIDSDTAIDLMERFMEVRSYLTFLLGGIFLHIQENQWHLELGYQSFEKMIETETGLARSTAYEYKRVYSDITTAGVQWDEVKSIGWSKLRVISDQLNAEGKKGWINIANSVSVQKLKECVKDAKKEAAQKALQPKYALEDKNQTSTCVDVKNNGDSNNKFPSVTEESAMTSSSYKTFKLYPLEEMSVIEALEKAKAELPTEYDNEALAAICAAYLAG